MTVMPKLSNVKIWLLKKWSGRTKSGKIAAGKYFVNIFGREENEAILAD